MRFDGLSTPAAIVAFWAALFTTVGVYLDRSAKSEQPEASEWLRSRESRMAAANEEKKGIRAFVVGHTGQIGRKLIEELAASESFSSVKLLGRREVDDLKTPKYAKFTQLVVDFENLDAHGDAFAESDVGFCMLGTTRGKSGVEGFKRVDFDYVLASAETAKKQNVPAFHLVTSQGANANSSFLYPQTKGRVEAAVTALGFDRLYVYRPSFLVGVDRPELRIGEKVAHCVLYPITKMFPTAMSVPIQTVAKAMTVVATTETQDEGKVAKIFDNAAIHVLGKDTSL